MSIIKEKINSFDKDMYGRKKIAVNLTKIIESKDESIVISLDSEWGTGKTTFINMWKDMLDSYEYNKTFKTIYFNAWENDYIRDPLIALFAELEDQLNDNDSKLKNTIKNAKDALIPLFKSAAIAGIKISTAGILDLEKVKFGDKTEDAILNAADKLGDFALKEIKVSKDVRLKFKKSMNEFQKEINKKIVFFIDELDRCRPTFAIELLEVIKHLFNIDNCIFIVSIDKEQLSHSVGTIYGVNMDTLGYLRRFFDLDYRLPRIDASIYIDNRISFNDKSNTDLFELFIKEIFKIEKFSLRDIDKAAYYLDILLPLIKEFNNKQKYSDIHIVTISFLYAMLISLKIKKPSVYKQIIDGDYIVADIINKITIPDLSHCKNINLSNISNPFILQEILNSILTPFLTLYFRFQKEGYARENNEYEFTIGLKNRDQSIDLFNSYNLLKLVNYDKISIFDNLEFIDYFRVF